MANWRCWLNCCCCLCSKLAKCVRSQWSRCAISCWRCLDALGPSFSFTLYVVGHTEAPTTVFGRTSRPTLKYTSEDFQEFWNIWISFRSEQEILDGFSTGSSLLLES